MRSNWSATRRACFSLELLTIVKCGLRTCTQFSGLSRAGARTAEQRIASSRRRFMAVPLEVSTSRVDKSNELAGQWCSFPHRSLSSERSRSSGGARDRPRITIRNDAAQAEGWGGTHWLQTAGRRYRARSPSAKIATNSPDGEIAMVLTKGSVPIATGRIQSKHVFPFVTSTTRTSSRLPHSSQHIPRLDMLWMRSTKPRRNDTLRLEQSNTTRFPSADQRSN